VRNDPPGALEQVNLGVYQSAGVRCWGTEPRALLWQGRCLDEHHLIFDLRDPLAGG
jgi:hypothetical protein